MITWKVFCEGALWIPKVEQCTTFFERLKGFIGQQESCSKGLWFLDSTALHTCFMSFSVDCYFLNGRNEILKIFLNVSPWKFVSCSRAASVIEIPTGTFPPCDLGQRLEFYKCDG